MKAIEKQWFAIDPMTLMLKGRAQWIWWEIHNPNTPPKPSSEEIRELFNMMSQEDKEALLSRAKVLARFGKNIKETRDIVMEIGRK